MYKVNFLPANLQREGVIDIKRLLTVAVSTLLIALALGSYGLFVIKFLSAKSELVLTKQQYNSLVPIVKKVEDIIKERKELVDTSEEYKTILAGQTTWSDLLYDLSDITPVDLWLTELQVTYKQSDQNSKNNTPDNTKQQENKNTASTPGQASTQKQKSSDVFPRPEIVIFKGFSHTVPSIGIFVNNLCYIPRFEYVKLNRIIAEKQAIKFEITAYVKDVEQ